MSSNVNNNIYQITPNKNYNRFVINFNDKMKGIYGLHDLPNKDDLSLSFTETLNTDLECKRENCSRKLKKVMYKYFPHSFKNGKVVYYDKNQQRLMKNLYYCDCGINYNDWEIESNNYSVLYDTPEFYVRLLHPDVFCEGFSELAINNKIGLVFCNNAENCDGGVCVQDFIFPFEKENKVYYISVNDLDSADKIKSVYNLLEEQYEVQGEYFYRSD